ncbi:MAG: hypothetical protein JO263_08355 [Candidatus Eremiobacteraeota bacterium]|nr:hypothetical protein [Candidatus Eremiobacteraeota bacterium]
MNTKSLAIGLLAIAFALPLGASAQQYPQAQAPAQQQQQNPEQRHGYNRTMPSEGRIQQRWNRRMHGLNLSSDQQQRMQSLIHQYSQTHPEGSAPDRASSRELHRQLMGMLTPDQRNYLRQLRQQRHQQMMQQRGESQPGAYGQPNQQYQPNAQNPQGAPADQQPGPPPA